MAAESGSCLLTGEGIINQSVLGKVSLNLHGVQRTSYIIMPMPLSILCDVLFSFLAFIIKKSSLKYMSSHLTVQKEAHELNGKKTIILLVTNAILKPYRFVLQGKTKINFSAVRFLVYCKMLPLTL